MLDFLYPFDLFHPCPVGILYHLLTVGVLEYGQFKVSVHVSAHSILLLNSCTPYFSTHSGHRCD